MPFLQHTARGAVAESRHAAFVKARLSGNAQCRARPPKVAGLLSPNIGGRTTRRERRSRTSAPAVAHNLPSIAARPPKAITQLMQKHGLAAVHDVGRDRWITVAVYWRQNDAVRAARQNVCVRCPRTACPRLPAESRYAAFAIARLSGSARCKARPLDHCRRILATERCRESDAAERLYPLPAHDLPGILGRPPKSAGLLSPDICGSTTRGERRSRTSVPTARAQLTQYSRPPAESRYAAYAKARLSSSARWRTRPLNRCRRILATERCRESGAAERLYPLRLARYSRSPAKIRRPAATGYRRPHDAGENGAAERLCPLPAHGLPV